MGRLGFLDSLRAVAIFGVILVHVAQSSLGLGPLATHVAEYGAKGVQLFFAVSGFTLGTVYQDRELNFGSFLIRRALRILPMFLVGIALYAVLGLNTDLRHSPELITPDRVLLTATLLHGWFEHTINNIVPGGWSIAAEWTFYLLFPALLILVKLRTTLLYLLFLSLVAVAVGAASFFAIRYVSGSHTFAYFFWLTQLPAFVLGLIVSVAWKKLSGRAGGIVFWTATVALLAAATVDTPLSNFFVANLLFAALIAGCASVRPVLLDNKVLRYVGEISFSLYIWHFAVVAILEVVVPAPMRTGVLGLLFLLTATFVCSVPISTLTYLFVEKPFIQLARRRTIPV